MTVSVAMAVEIEASSAVPLATKKTSIPEQDAAAARIPVLLPDMFVSFFARKPILNPHYEKTKIESEAWINRSVD